jgi:hypothetical protein
MFLETTLQPLYLLLAEASKRELSGVDCSTYERLAAIKSIASLTHTKNHGEKYDATRVEKIS